MSSTADNDDTLRKIFVGGLDYETNEQAVGTYFETWGPLAECCIKRFPDGRSRGFAFVTFCSLAALEQCLATTGHRIIKINLFQIFDTGDQFWARVKKLA